ncbi:hypothetical protein MMC28_008083 [Mycoblastus sanguinarius]|nr:hypothetical protein [Mycoblastus sanguinarius]
MLSRQPVKPSNIFLQHVRFSPRQWLQPYSAPSNALPSTSSQHNVSTYLAHATPTFISRASTVQIGTAYEYLCAQTLPRIGFKDLTRTGGPSDKGIDLLGQWVLPSLSPVTSLEDGNRMLSLPVIVQCKATSRKPGPEMVRELQGAVAGAPGLWRRNNTIGVLCAKRKATMGVRDAVKRCGRGVVWVMIEDLDESDDAAGLKEEGKESGGRRRGRVKQILWNERVGKMVGEGVGAGLRYVPGLNGIEKEVCLTLEATVWEPEMGTVTD